MGDLKTEAALHRRHIKMGTVSRIKDLKADMKRNWILREYISFHDSCITTI